MNTRRILPLAILTALAASSALAGEDGGAKKALDQKLWPRERIEAAIAAVEKQHKDGLLSEESYAKRKALLADRLAGKYVPESLAVSDPPLNFIQNGGFEQINKNSGRNRSRWLWWGGWDWGGNYENSWEERPGYVHSGKFSARIACVGQRGRIGISTPGLPAVPGATGYTLTFWAKGEGDNLLFVNFEGGSSGSLRQKIGPDWREYTVVGKPTPDGKSFNVYFYHVGLGTIWLDDVKLVPQGGTLEE